MAPKGGNIAVGKEMCGYVVGPMPVDEFLTKFLPESGIPNYQPTATGFKSGSFQRTVSAESEEEGSASFVDEIRAFAPNLHFVNTHARGDKRYGSEFEIKPDVSVYHVSPDIQDPITDCNVATLDIHVEFKWSNQYNPFLVSSPHSCSNSSFIDTKARDTLGQISVYAAAQMGAQFRTHIFSIFILCGMARLIRWDREGAIVTGPVMYNEDPSLVDFFCRYSQAPPELRGVDTTVSLACEDEANLARKKLSLPKEVPMYATSVPLAASLTEQPGDELKIIFPMAKPPLSLPACRATRACPAYDPIGDRVVFFKDSWRINTTGTVPEGKTYEKLNGENISNVPVCLAHGDVKSTREQQPQTAKAAQSPWTCSQDLTTISHIHSRLILDIVGRKLTEFTSPKELVKAIHDALIAHRQAFRIKLLHQDISPGNIIIFRGTGYLIDWEFARCVDECGRHQITRTGTWQFMSAHLIEHDDASQTLVDDLESAFWVLLWTAIMFSKPSLSDEQLSDFVHRTFELEGEGKRSMLVSQTILQSTLFPDQEQLDKLLKDLADNFSLRYIPLRFKRFLGPQLHTMSKNIQDHEYTLKLFSDCLSEWDHPLGGVPDPQLSTCIDPTDGGLATGISLQRSKHMLTLSLPENLRKKKRRKMGR